METIVFGGSGLVGYALKQIKRDWIYLSSKDGDLRNLDTVDKLINKYKPKSVVFLAANVGGLYKNMKEGYKIFMDNLKMEMNIIETCNKYGIKNGVFCLSTCIYPDKTSYPIKEEYIHDGKPHDSNYGYSYAKRNLEVMCRLSNETFGSNFKCIIPTNIYGENDNFSLENGHVLPALIHKAYLVNKKVNETFEIKGDGNVLRQFIYSGDIAKLICKILNLKKNEKFILSPEKEYLIKDIVKKISTKYNIPNEKIIYTNDSTGQYKKTVSNEKIKKYFPDFIFTSLDEGLDKTIYWVNKNYDNMRK